MSRAGETTPGPDQQKLFAAFFQKKKRLLASLDCHPAGKAAV
jgi:hypothetical protein